MEMGQERLDLRNGYNYRSEEGFRLLQSTLSPEGKSIMCPTPPSVQKKHLLESTAQKISAWLRSSTEHNSSIVWLTGLPDSSSLNEVVALCQSSQQLVAMFSFSTRKGDQQKKEILPSLAYQIAISIPSLRSAIGFAVFQDPQILSSHLDAQMRCLLLRPFDGFVSANFSPARPVVIIDGVELFHDRVEQEVLISQIELATTSGRLPLRFIFASRSEEYTPPLHSATHIVVDNSAVTPPDHDSSMPKLPSSPTRKSFVHMPRGFPRFVQTQYSIGGPESYSRSLMMLGHGVPLWRPEGSLNRPPVHIDTGVRIGDVMLLDPEGTYEILLNIFCDEYDPVQSKATLGYFKPIQPPLDSSEVRYTESYFKPGTAITSPGVTATTASASPLRIQIESNSQEGAVLVLPRGASREDLISTHRFREYVKNWAPYWYRMSYGVNGSLFLVTGCDKASDFALFSFPSQRPLSSPWFFDQHVDIAENWWHPSIFEGFGSADRQADSRNLCIFVRGMRIALGESTWSGAMGPAFRDDKRSYTTVLHKTPSMDQATTSVLALLHRRFSEPTALKELDLARKQLIHPVFFLGPALLSKYPTAMAVLIDDTIWCSFVDKQKGGSLDSLNKLVDTVLEKTTIINQDGVVYLSLRPESNENTPNSASFGTLPNRGDDRWGKLVPISQYAAARMGRPSRPPPM